MCKSHPHLGNPNCLVHQVLTVSQFASTASKNKSRATEHAKFPNDDASPLLVPPRIQQQPGNFFFFFFFLIFCARSTLKLLQKFFTIYYGNLLRLRNSALFLISVHYYPAPTQTELRVFSERTQSTVTQ
jgi:hypothetical protein